MLRHQIRRLVLNIKAWGVLSKPVSPPKLKCFCHGCGVKDQLANIMSLKILCWTFPGGLRRQRRRLLRRPRRRGGRWRRRRRRRWRGGTEEEEEERRRKGRRKTAWGRSGPRITGTGLGAEVRYRVIRTERPIWGLEPTSEVESVPGKSWRR